MPEDKTAADSTENVDNDADTDAGADAGADQDDAGDGDASALKEPGKRALDSMKSKWIAERDKRKASDARIAELEAANSTKVTADADKPDVESIKRNAETAATKAANQRILKAEVRAAAAGKLADPSDALTMIDVSKLEVDSDGNVDADEIADAIDALLVKKPYLSAQGGKRFQGSADGGARKTNRDGAQLTKADLNGMDAAAIVKARKEGRLTDLGYK